MRKLDKWRTEDGKYLKDITLKNGGTPPPHPSNDLTGPKRCSWSFSWSTIVCWSLIRVGLSGRAAVTNLFLRKRNREKISGNRCCGAMNPNVNVLVLIISMHGGHDRGVHRSWFRAAEQSIFSTMQHHLMVLWCPKITIKDQKQSLF